MQSTQIEEDWPCVSCGYNLRTMNVSGRCPECNKPVDESLRIHDARSSDDLLSIRGEVAALTWTPVIYGLVLGAFGIVVKVHGFFWGPAFFSTFFAVLVFVFCSSNFTFVAHRLSGRRIPRAVRMFLFLAILSVGATGITTGVVAVSIVAVASIVVAIIWCVAWHARQLMVCFASDAPILVTRACAGFSGATLIFFLALGVLLIVSSQRVGRQSLAYPLSSGDVTTIGLLTGTGISLVLMWIMMLQISTYLSRVAKRADTSPTPRKVKQEPLSNHPPR